MNAELTSFKRELLSTLPSLRAFAVSLSGRHDKADDLVQDTVMKAWAKQESFEMGTNSMGTSISATSKRPSTSCRAISERPSS